MSPAFSSVELVLHMEVDWINLRRLRHGVQDGKIPYVDNNEEELKNI